MSFDGVDSVELNTSAYDATLERMIARGLRQFRFPTPNNWDSTFGQSQVSSEVFTKPSKRDHTFELRQKW